MVIIFFNIIIMLDIIHSLKSSLQLINFKLLFVFNFKNNHINYVDVSFVRVITCNLNETSPNASPSPEISK